MVGWSGCTAMSQIPATATSWGMQYGHACANSVPSYYQFTTFGAAWAFDRTGKMLWKGTGGQVNQTLITGWINASAPNNPPVANAGADQAVNQGVTVNLSGTGSSDPDGDPLTYSWTKTVGPNITITGANTATPSFTAPPVSTSTLITLQLSVNDGKGGTDTDTVDITVNPGPLPPNANAGSNQGATFNASVQLNGGNSSDPNGDPLTYSWTQIGGGTVTLTGANTATPTFTSPAAPDNLVFQLQVTDTGSLSDTATVTIFVNATGQMPLSSATGGGGGGCAAGAGGAGLFALLGIQLLVTLRRRRQ